jgi:hypothetical protein
MDGIWTWCREVVAGVSLLRKDATSCGSTSSTIIDANLTDVIVLGTKIQGNVYRRCLGTDFDSGR